MFEVAAQRKSYAKKESLGEYTDPHDRVESVFPPPPPPLEDSRGVQRYLVEQLLNHRDVNGRRTSYLVRWRGYPPSWDTREPRSQLMTDILGLVEQYDTAHPVLQKDRRRKSSRHGRRGISGCQSLRTSQ
uniref:Chromo domain-containing protein n=1 Tax=Peronospora matthiolae TaxID=2874970 RepID=A0AAV1UNI9_9STRA